MIIDHFPAMGIKDVLGWSVWSFNAAMDPPKGPHPPYTIHKIKGKYFVKNALGEKKNGTGYKTRAEAVNLQQALYAALPPEMKQADVKKASEAAPKSGENTKGAKK